MRRSPGRDGQGLPSMLVLGARRLGGAIVSRFASKGCRVAAVSLSEQTAQSVREQNPDVLTFHADLSRGEEMERVVDETLKQFGTIDLAVNAISPFRSGIVTGGSIVGLSEEAMLPYTGTLVPEVFHFLRVVGNAMVAQNEGALIQVTGGSARRAMAFRGPWAAAAAATRALTHAAAQELREQRVHVALLIVDAVIESDKTVDQLAGKPTDYSTTHDDVVDAIEYLMCQSPRAWTHELTLTPIGDRWVP